MSNSRRKEKEELTAVIAICDDVRKSDRKIRHLGYYDSFGRILYDSIREKLIHLEGTEEMHILNGTMASMLNLWKPASPLIGKVQSFIMIREKIVGLIIPHDRGNYFLVIFEARTPIQNVEKARARLNRLLNVA